MIDNDEFIAAKTRLTLAKAEREELKLAQDKGELIPRDVVMQSRGDTINIVKNKLLAIPELAAQLYTLKSAGAMKTALKTKVYEILNELAEEDTGLENYEPVESAS